MYKIEYKKQAVKQISRLSQNWKKRITQKISELKKDPFSPTLNVKKYQGTQKTWKLRIGNIRVIYQVETEIRIILIQKVGFRGDIYK